ncbi:sensor histidine kinase [Pseudohongiella sp.]|uniref:PAS domain-containing protein n=1 Tax=marine sediment metagenome TaxID=412755 RepID=A0A0F9W477_9ZZZZ|nr:PAS domain-containing protein [Pseudohongiella sp.]HDZ10242.1 PAS domain S-box protein [Pseudohongiella sp.]HEA64222.1 PAS domain S-box protein [Pseudohongiella sp.]
MKQILALGILLSVSINAYADMFAVFRDEDGTTNWQYIANTSASLLILILLVVLFFLVRANLRAGRSNRALKEIKATLEDRVARRTQVLEETAEQLRKREAYITSIVNSMPVMLIGINDQLQVTQWNKTAEEITGRPFADVTGKNLWAAYPAITLTDEQVNSVLTSGQTLHLKHTQRGQYSFDITLYRLRDSDDTGIVILISDITKQVNAENKVAERDKLSALGELASAMAYDISLPINTILQHVSDAKDKIEATDLGSVQPALLQEVEVVRQSAQQATAISQNLLDLARSHSNAKQVADIPVIMDQSIEQASDLFTDSDGLAFRDIEIRRSYADDLPPMSCFPAELEQAFSRVLRSAYYALKASALKDGEQSPPRIHIEIGQFFDSLWIKVLHKGKPLAASEQLEIFEPFFVATSDNGSYPVEYRLSYPYFIITEHHRGHMSVTSDEHFGTCFNIQLSLV